MNIILPTLQLCLTLGRQNIDLTFISYSNCAQKQCRQACHYNTEKTKPRIDLNKIYKPHITHTFYQILHLRLSGATYPGSPSSAADDAEAPWIPCCLQAAPERFGTRSCEAALGTTNTVRSVGAKQTCSVVPRQTRGRNNSKSTHRAGHDC